MLHASIDKADAEKLVPYTQWTGETVFLYAVRLQCVNEKEAVQNELEKL